MNKVYHCFFEQSGTFKNEFKKLGYQAFDYDIKNDFEETDYIVDLFQEIESAYDNKESIFDRIKKNDMILAFFPCVRFEDQIQMHFRGTSYQYKNYTDEQKLELDLKLHSELSMLYELITKLAIVCLRRKISLIIENPYSTTHYLVKYWAIPYTILDMNRRENGDYYEKPTQYWFFNCEPKNNVIFEPIEYVEQKKCNYVTNEDQCRTVLRSIIHPQYANRFIREFILESEANVKKIVSVSFGKDSLAMLLLLLERNEQLDEVIFYDTGMEFQAIYDIRDKIVPILKEKGIKYKELKPKQPFEYTMFNRPVKHRDGTCSKGYSWCGGRCRWGTTEKNKTITKYLKDNYGEDYKEYVGIAYDEPKRIKDDEHKIYPLYDLNFTEENCLQYCYERGFYWEEDGVKLYDILDRVSCWCCANKNLKELKNYYKYLPNHWNKLKDYQKRTERPFKNNKYRIEDLEEKFKKEEDKK